MVGSSTFAYEQADPGNLASVVNKKISSAMKMAAEERKYQDDKIKTLADKKERTEEEQQELKKLTDARSTRKKGSFFGKALAHEFGGDMFRRVGGGIKSLAGRDVKDSEDPTISKRERFSNLIRNSGLSVTPPRPEPKQQVEYDQPSLFDTESYTKKEKGTPVKDESLGKVLTKVFDDVKTSYDNLSASISKLSNNENAEIKSSDNKTKGIASIGNFLQSLKGVFDKQTQHKKLEVEVEKDTLQFEIQSAEEIQDAKREAEFEQDNDLSKSFDYAMNDGDKKSGSNKNKNIFEKIFDAIGDLRTKRDAKSGVRSRRFGRGSSLFGRGRRSPGVRKPTSMGRTSYTKPIGPQPINSSTPWAAKGAGDRGGIYGHSGFTPRLESNLIKMSSGGIVKPQQFNNPMKKLAAGGVVDNPTTLSLNQMGPSAVIPQRKIREQQKRPGAINRTAPGKGMAEPLGRALELPTVAAGGLLLSTMVESLQNFGFLGKIFSPILKTMFSPLASVFGLPAGIIGALVGGGSANAATLGNMMLGNDFNQSSSESGGGGGGGGSPGGGGGGGGGGTLQAGPSMTATGGSTASQFITSGFGQRNTGIPGASTDHGGIDIAGGPWKEGTPVSVIKPGVVEETGDLGSSGWGKYVVVKHDDGTYSLYGHLKQTNVKKGDKIENKSGAAKVIGTVGSTGVSSGPHLHFELGTGWNGTIKDKVNPAPYVDSYIRGGGDVKIDAPVVAAAGPAAPATPAVQPPGAAPQPGASIQTMGLTLPTPSLNNVERTSSASNKVSPWSVASPFDLGYQQNW